MSGERLDAVKAFRVKAKRDVLTSRRAHFVTDLSTRKPFHNFELMGDSVLVTDHSTDSESESDSESDSDVSDDDDVYVWLLRSEEHDTHVDVEMVFDISTAAEQPRHPVTRRAKASEPPIAERVQVDYVPVVHIHQNLMRVGLVIRRQRVRYVCVFVDAQEMQRGWDAYNYVPRGTDLLAIFTGFRMKVDAGVCRAPTLVTGNAGFKHWITNDRCMAGEQTTAIKGRKESGPTLLDGERFTGPGLPNWVRVPGTGAVLDTKRCTFLDETAATCAPSTVPCRGGVIIGEPGSGRCQAAVYACDYATRKRKLHGPDLAKQPFHTNAILVIVPACAVPWRKRELQTQFPRAVVTALTSKTDLDATSWGDILRSDYVLVSVKFLQSHPYIMHVHTLLANVCDAPEKTARHLHVYVSEHTKPTPAPRNRKRRRVDTASSSDVKAGVVDVDVDFETELETNFEPRLTRTQAQQRGVTVDVAATAAFAEAKTFFNVDRASILHARNACPFVARQIKYMASAARRILGGQCSQKQWQTLRRPVLEVFVFRGMVVLDADRHSSNVPSRIKQLTAAATWVTDSEFSESTSASLLHRWSVVLPPQIDAMPSAFSKFQFIANRLCCRLNTPKPGCNVYVDRVHKTNREYVAELAAEFDLNNADTNGASRYESLFSPAAQTHESVRIVPLDGVVDALLTVSAQARQALRQRAEDVPADLSSAVADVFDATSHSETAGNTSIEFIFVDDSHMFADGQTQSVNTNAEVNADADVDDEYDMNDDEEDDDENDNDDNDDNDDDERDTDSARGRRLMRTLAAAAENYAELSAEIENHERSAVTLKDRASACVDTSIGKDLCSICIDNKVCAMIGCGHAFCLECILQWYSSNKKCPTCCATCDRVAIVVADDDVVTPPAIPQLPAAKPELWRRVTQTQDMTSATFWILSRLTCIEASGRCVVIMTARPGDARVLLKALLPHRAEHAIPIKSMCDAHGSRESVTRAFERLECHVIVPFVDVVSGAYFRNVTHVMCLLDGEDDEDDDEEQNTLRAITALQAFSAVPAIDVYALKHLRPARVCASL